MSATPLHPRPTPEARSRSLGAGKVRLALALAVVFLNAWILVHFHDQFWWAPDEGNYAHVAERILDGEVLHADVQDIHPGYVNFANAGAMALFGRELVSMRYPLIALGIAQCVFVLLVLAPYGGLAGAVGATAITALGFVQFLDPTAHWYALFLVTLLAAVLHRPPRKARWRLEAIGAIVMTAVLFRQLSGVFVAMGAITFLLLEHADDARLDAEQTRASPWLARALVAVMLVGITGYLLRATEQVGWMLFGIWPVLLLLRTGWLTRMSNRVTLTMLLRLARGGLVAALPLIAYHIAHQSFGAWYQDTVVTASRFPRMPFFDAMNYGTHAAGALGTIMVGGLQGALNGIFWVALTLLAAVVGILLLRQLVRPAAAGVGAKVPPLAVLSVFYAVVSVHYQIPIYLTYTAGFSLVALIALTRGARPVLVGGVALAAIALYYHAGQPLSRGLGGASEGQRAELVADTALARVGLRVEPADNALYRDVIELIHRDVPPSGTIFAVPSHAELYFLAERRNPFRFFNTALGVRTERDLTMVLETIERDPPVLVFYDRRDKYNTQESRAIMERVIETYEPLPPIGPFEIFRRSGARVAAGPSTQSSKE
jgi:hypothetical protein